jgi:histidine triad (HIT) family protein
MEKDCIFCKIVSGEIPTHFTYEDEFVVAFPDIHPKAPGHTLLIPKEHYVWFEEMPDELYSKLFLAAKKITKDLKQKTGADYVHLSIVGKDVPHVHVHLIPQFLDK